MLVRRTPSNPAQSLCFEDDSLRTEVESAASTTYQVRMVGGAKLDTELGAFQFQPDPTHEQRSCIRLPVGGKRPHELAGAKAADTDPLRYGVVEIDTKQAGGSARRIRIHLYDLGPERGFRLVGIERPPV